MKAFDKLTIVHFLQYFIFGLYIKNKYLLVLLVGILWEIFEYLISNNNFTYNLLKKCWPIEEKYWNEKNIYNKVIDIISNMLGYHFGNKIKLF